MSFLIPDALAAGPATASSPASGFGTLVLLVGFILVFYILLWRPPSKRAKQHRELIGSLAKGDEVITSGGIVGRISKVNDDFVTVAIAENVEIKVQKPAISAVLPKGSMKTE